MHPDTYLQLHRLRAAELQAQAAEHHLVSQAKRPRNIRTRVGWTLVEVGLRLAAAPKPVPAV